MNKIYYFLFLSLLLGACTKEDALEPTGANDDYFTVPATATDPESVMRREFYEETGVHLLFNDTLRHEQRGTFEDGNPRWYTETVDLGYSMTSFDDAPALTYLQTKQEKEKPRGQSFRTNQQGFKFKLSINVLYGYALCLYEQLLQVAHLQR